MHNTFCSGSPQINILLCVTDVCSDEGSGWRRQNRAAAVYDGDAGYGRLRSLDTRLSRTVEKRRSMNAA